MNYLLKNIIVATLLSTGLIKTMEQESNNGVNQTLSLKIIKAAVERDGDTMINILQNTPIEQRNFFINFPEYNYCVQDEGQKLAYAPTCKVCKNYFNLVDIYKPGNYIGMRIERESMPMSDAYDYLKIKDSQGKLYEFAINKPNMQQEWVKQRKITLTPLMLAAYSKDTNGIQQELSKSNYDQDTLTHSLFISIAQDCSSCVETLLSKKDSLIMKGVFGGKRDEDNYALYRALLQEASDKENLNIFEMLIKTNPLDCLNTPGRYPITNYSDLQTVLDYYIWQARSGKKNQRAFFQKCVDICKQYGAKTLNDLEKEGYNKPQEPKDPYARYKFGYIED